MFISPAFAQAAGGGLFGGGGGGLDFLFPMILIFVVFYFLLIRPQQKKQKAHRELLGGLNRGDRVVTSGGIIGTITKISDDNILTIEIAQGVKVKALRGTIADVISRGGTASGNDDGDD